tara:strand:+ start:274 stop:435 length:162 start_codon:yes stop_codon:yes gene_type:complete
MITVESPCIGLCELKDNICIGCNRTDEQITNWEAMSQEEKEKVINALSSTTTQ